MEHRALGLALTGNRLLFRKSSYIPRSNPGRDERVSESIITPKEDYEPLIPDLSTRNQKSGMQNQKPRKEALCCKRPIHV